MQLNQKTISKVNLLCETYKKLIFTSVGELNMDAALTREHLRTPPEMGEASGNVVSLLVPNSTEEDKGLSPVVNIGKGQVWGGAWQNLWLKGSFKVTADLANKPIYMRVLSGARESMLFINSKPIGIFNNLFMEEGVRSNHHILLVTPGSDEGESFDVSVECYAGHPCVGCFPRDERDQDAYNNSHFECTYDGTFLMEKDETVNRFVNELTVLSQIANHDRVDPFVRGKIYGIYEDIFMAVEQFPEQLTKEQWLPGIEAALEIMKPLLELKNGDAAPKVGLIGHSHMDTAWLWTVGETIRKCARTYSNALNLMRQYPDYRFVQSSAYHIKMMEKHYPEIYAEMKERIEEGRWEPNGGGWIEPDGYMPSGESFVRNFLRGQKYTKEKFDYLSDTFWLPDTFGYSAALPQIMQGCGIKYLTTTKLTWNETNNFPYDSFYWHGIDETEVLTHFNWTHCAPDPETLLTYVYGEDVNNSPVVKNGVVHKDVSDRRLVSYGLGDGGGGPEYEMIEMADYVKDQQGCPQAEHMSVTDFMTKLETECPNLPAFKGELYMEGHRGTLTTMAKVKRWNRKLEAKLHNLEFIDVCRRLSGDSGDFTANFDKLWNDVLVNQFHDILPGTSIPEVTDWSIRRFEKINKRMDELCGKLLNESVEAFEDSVRVFNSLSWERDTFSTASIPENKKIGASGVKTQHYENVYGEHMSFVSGAAIPALGSVDFNLDNLDELKVDSPFEFEGKKLKTPIYTAYFDDNGYIVSLFDKRANREVSGGGNPLNTFYIGEDAPFCWDNWDIDRDQHLKMKPIAADKALEVVSDGELMFRLRSRYKFGSSSLVQDMIFYADSARIDFETRIDWKEKHQLLKAGFDVNIQADQMRNEIQFGHVSRPTHGNYSQDDVKFEVCNHKWTNISETRYGVSVLNDSKYGISVDASDMRLTLVKSGMHPDPRGDEGVHDVTYSLLPHDGGFSTENVVRPAYELNNDVVLSENTSFDKASLAIVDQPNVIVESVKPAEDGSGVVFRIYECECNRTSVRITFPNENVKVVETDMLERDKNEIESSGGTVRLEFRPFEIKTLKLCYA